MTEKTPSPTRPWVNAFADAMEAKLAANRRKGDRPAWSKASPADLLARLEVEVDELHAALVNGESPERIVRECADVGNFAMMIADVAGGMKPREYH